MAEDSAQSTPATASAPARPAAAPPLWSYQPVKHEPVPKVQDSKWVRTPVDAFVLAKLEANGIKPSPEASRAAFTREAQRDAGRFSDPANRASWSDVAKSLGQACKDCHDMYRVKRE